MKKLTRRKFLAAAPVVGGAVLGLSGSALGQSIEAIDAPVTDPLTKLSWKSFYPFITTDFSFGSGSNAVTLKLVDMIDSAPKSTSRRPSRGQECFILKFQGPYYQPLEQGTYEVSHFRLGDFNLFITQGGRTGNQQFYLAVINRITE